jgi:hypothetical protein
MKFFRLVPLLTLMAIPMVACTDPFAPDVEPTGQQVVAPPTVPAPQQSVADNCEKFQGYLQNGTVYNGCADGVDGYVDGLYYGGVSIFTYDKLLMKWNQGWNDGNAEGWSNPPYDAAISNEWNGNFLGGSGQTWRYLIRWVGACGADGTLLPGPRLVPAYCIWGQFAVEMSQGSIDSQHFWDAHGGHPGFGNRP